MYNLVQNCQQAASSATCCTDKGARCPFSISIAPPSPSTNERPPAHSEEDARYEECAAKEHTPMPQRPKGRTGFSSGSSDEEVDASVLCPHYDEHHKGKHYQQYLRQKEAEAQTIKDTSRPPLWRVPIVRQPLPVSIEEFNPAEPQYAKFVKALWSHAKATVEDKEAAEDFAQSPMGQDAVPQRCPDLDEAGWRRGLLQHSWEDRPGTVGRPLSPTFIRKGTSWLVDAEGYEGPFGSPGDLRSRGMAYDSRFQLPTLSSLMKAKHAVFVKAKDPKEAKTISERQSVSTRRSRTPQRLRVARCRSTPPQLKVVTEPSESEPPQPQQQQPQKLSPRALSPSLLRPPASPLSPNGSVRAGQNGSPRGSLPGSPKTSSPPSPCGSPKSQTKEKKSPRSPLNKQEKKESVGENCSWAVHIRGKGKYQYPESYIRWKRERKRMRERLKKLRAGEIFTSDRPKEVCTDCETPTLCWDPQPFTEHLQAVRSFGSAPDDDASSGSDLSPSSRRSSSSSTSRSGSNSSSRSCSPTSEDNNPTPEYKLRTAAIGNTFPSSTPLATGVTLMPPSPLYPIAAPVSGAAAGSYLHTQGVSGLLQRSISSPVNPFFWGNGMQLHPPWLAGIAPTSLVMPPLQQQQNLVGQQQTQQGQLLLQQLQQRQQQTLLQPQIPPGYMAVQLPGTGFMHPTIAVQPSQSVAFEQKQQQQQQQQQPLEREEQQEAQKQEQQNEQLVDSSRPQEERRNNNAAPFTRSKQQQQQKQQNNTSSKHRYLSAPPPASRHTGKGGNEQPFPSSTASAPPPVHTPATSPLPPQPFMVAPSQQLFGGPQLLSAGPGGVQAAPQLQQQQPIVLQGTPPVVQGAPAAAVLPGWPLLVPAGTQLVSKIQQQIHPGGPWNFSGVERFPRQQQQQQQQPNAAAAAASHRSASCSPPGAAMVVAPLPLLPQQQTPILVRQLQQQPVLVQQPQQQATLIQQQQHPLLIRRQGQSLVVQRQQQQPLVIQQQQPLVIQQPQQQTVLLQQQQQQPIVIQQLQPATMPPKQQSPQQNAVQQQQPSATIVIQPQQPVVVAQQQPAVVVKDTPATKPEEQTPAAPATPKAKPKTQWLWSCSVDCGAKCGGDRTEAPQGTQQQQQQQQQQQRGKQPTQRLQRTQETLQASPREAPAAAPLSPTQRTGAAVPVAAAVPAAAPVSAAAAVPAAVSTAAAPAQQVRYPSQQPAGSGSSQAGMQFISQTYPYLQPPQQQLHSISPRQQGQQQQQQQPQQTLLMPPPLSTMSPTTFVPAAPGTQHIFASSAPVVCVQGQPLQQQQQQQRQQQQPTQDYRQSPCCPPPRGRDGALQEPRYKYLPFTFISSKRNIACGVGKKITSKQPPAAASLPTQQQPQQQQQQQQRSSCCTANGNELSASLSCSI